MFPWLNRLSRTNRMTLMAARSNLRSMIPMNWRGRMLVSYSSVHDDGSIIYVLALTYRHAKA